jgi:hypothetical protein
MLLRTGDDDRQTGWEAYKLGLKGQTYQGPHEEAWRAGWLAKQRQAQEWAELQARAAEPAASWSWLARVEALLRSRLRLGRRATDHPAVKASAAQPTGWRLLRSLR